MEQTERIKQMELLFDRASQAVMELSAAIDKYVEAQESIKKLKAYYASDAWRQDYADDEAGRLPKELKRGVLSEDGVWNMLSDSHELNVRVQGIIAEILSQE